MEEKVEKPVDQKDDELKNEVESKAKQNNSLDEKTAVVDEDNKIVDIDTVLSKNKELSTKVDNLSKIGFGKEYIRRLIELDSSFSIGSSEDELKKELDKITDLVIKTISGIKNGIVLNLDGSRDDTASEAQKKELDESSDVFSRSYILKKETIDKVFDEVFGTINVEKNNIEINELIDFVNFKEYGTLINEIIDEEEFKEIFNENGISEEEQKQIEKIEEDVYITADGTDDIDIELLYKYLENPENVAEVLEGRIKANPDSKFLKGLLDENGKLKKDAIQERVDDFQEKRNMIDVINDLKHFKGVIYERLANDDREKFISTLTRAQQFKENKMVAVLINIISNKNAIEVTPEQLIRMHNDIKDDNEPDIENEEDLYNYYSKDSFNAKTRDKRLNKYRKNEKNKKNERFASNVSVRAKKIIIRLWK